MSIHTTPPVRYGKESQLVSENDSPSATEKGKKYIQQVLGRFLYYARAIDMTILHALSAIASETITKYKQLIADPLL